MNLIELALYWDNLRQYSAMSNTPFVKILLTTSVEGVPTVGMMSEVIGLGNELSIVEVAIDNLEREAVEFGGAGV